MTESSQSSLTRAVEERGALSIIDMKPIASLGPQTSTTFSPITISTTPDCTTNMVEPGSPRLNTSLPAAKLMLVPARRANSRMSRSLPSIILPRHQLALSRFCHAYATRPAKSRRGMSEWAGNSFVVSKCVSLRRVAVELARLRRLFLALRRHFRGVFAARDTARAELAARQIVFGRPFVFVDLTRDDLTRHGFAPAKITGRPSR